MLTTYPVPLFTAVVVGCLPPFKSLFTPSFSSSAGGRYSFKRSKSVSKPSLGSAARNGSMQLQSQDKGYTTRVRAAERVLTSDSQEGIVGVGHDEETGGDVIRGDIRVQRDFVGFSSWFIL